MIFSRAVIAACATVLGFMLYVVAGLLALLTVVAHLRGDAASAPAETLALAAGAAAAGFACRFIARKIAAAA